MSSSPGTRLCFLIIAGRPLAAMPSDDWPWVCAMTAGAVRGQRTYGDVRASAGSIPGGGLGDWGFVHERGPADDLAASCYEKTSY